MQVRLYGEKFLLWRDTAEVKRPSKEGARTEVTVPM